MRVSPSQLRTWKECQQAWHYSYVEGLKLKKSSKYFDIGTYTHELLHVMYQTMKAMGWKPGSDNMVDMMQSRIKADMESLDLDNIDVMSIVWPLVTKYVSFQSSQIDKGITVLGIEHEVRQELDNGLIIHGFIDLVYRDSAGRIRIRDHKTSGQKNSWNPNKVKMNEQLLLYALAVGLEFGEPVLDVEISFVNTYPYKNKQPSADELFKLFRHTHNEQAINSYRKNLQRMHDQMLEGNIMRNYSESCGSCRFFDLCYLETRGLNADNTRAAMYQKIERD